jgi:hypothetical protein
VDLIELPRNNAITLALNALLKNAIKKWEGSYVPQLVSSKKASYEIEEHRLIFENEHEEHGLIFDRILPFGMVLNVIDFYKLYSKQELFTVLKLFAQFVIITEEEYELIKRYNLTRKFPVEWLENGILCRYTYVGIDIDRDDYI